MQLKRFTTYLLERPILGAFLTLIVSFIPYIGMIGALYAALVTMRKTWWEGAAMMIVATLPILPLAFVVQKGGMSIALFSLVVIIAAGSNIVTWISAFTLRRGHSWSYVLQAAALLGGLFISVVHLAMPEVGEWLGKTTYTIYAQFMENIQTISAVPSGVGKPAEASLSANTLARIQQSAMGIVMLMVLLCGLSQLTVARWWYAYLQGSHFLKFELHHIRLSKLAALLFVISLVLAHYDNAVILDILPILWVLFCVAGLSKLHDMLNLAAGNRAYLGLFLIYITLIYSVMTANLLPIILIAMVGLTNALFDFKQRK